MYLQLSEKWKTTINSDKYYDEVKKHFFNDFSTPRINTIYQKPMHTARANYVSYYYNWLIDWPQSLGTSYYSCFCFCIATQQKFVMQEYYLSTGIVIKSVVRAQYTSNDSFMIFQDTVIKKKHSVQQRTRLKSK